MRTLRLGEQKSSRRELPATAHRSSAQRCSMKSAFPCLPFGFTAGAALCWWSPERQGSFGSRCGSADRRSGSATRGPPRHFCWPSRRTAPQVMIHRRRRAEVPQSCYRPPAEAGGQTQGEPASFFGFEKPDYRRQTGGATPRPRGRVLA
jgi:hypothetical protein